MFPTNLVDLPNPDPKAPTNSPVTPLAGGIANLNAVVEALQAKVGVDGSTVPTSIEYRLADVQAVASAAAPAETAGAVAIAGKIGAAALVAALQNESTSVAMQVLSDSTGNETTEWPHLVAQALAAAFPRWTVQTRVFNDTTQQYGAPTTLQTGPLGERYFDRTTGTSPRAVDLSQTQHLSGVVDVRAKLMLSDWTPAAIVTVCGRSSTAPNRGWYAYINTDGRPYFAYSTDGTALAAMGANADTSIADGSTYWLRWLFTPNDGSGNRVFKAYKSPNGSTWTQIGTTVTTAGAVSIYDNNSIAMECGGITGGVSAGLTRLYEIQIRNGEDGPLVAPALPDLWPPQSSIAANFTGSPTLTVLNGSVAGAGIATTGGAYLANATRLPKLLPQYGQALCICATSHNDGSQFGRSYRATYAAWLADLETKLPHVPILCLVQNPEKSGTTFYREHNARRADILACAAAKGLTTVDIAAAFTLNPAWDADYMADSVHPNAAGQSVWAAEVLRYVLAAENR